MADLKVHKVVSALPQTLEPDSIYLVRTGAGFDLYATNHSGTIISYPANYQPKNANLSALAGLTGSQNKMMYFTAESTLALADLTVFGRQLIASADAPAARTALGLGTAASAVVAEMPFVNLLPDSGRFGGKIDPTTLQLGASFVANSGWFPVYNGASVASGGKFIHDNSTFGGSGGALTESVTSLLTAMGRSIDSRRYGAEFFVAAVTAGSGTSVPYVGADGVTRYPCIVMQRMIASSATLATFVSWVRAKTGSCHLLYPAYVDGVLRSIGYVLPAGWHHIRLVANSDYGYFSLMPYLLTTVGAVLEFALPAYYSGSVDVGLHKAPLMTVNGVST